MMALDQLFEARFDLRLGCPDVEPQRVERLALGIANRPTRFGPRPTLGAQPFPEKTEGVGGVAAEIRPDTTSTRPHSPCRPMAGDGVLLVGHHCGIAHSGEEIVGLVVGADVREAKAPVFPLAPPPLGRAVRCLFLATRPFANRRIAPRARVEPR